MSSLSVGESVVITGIGLVTPLGVTRESTWSALLAGARAGAVLSPARMGPAWEGIVPGPTWRGCPVSRTGDYAGEPIIGDALTAACEAVTQAQLGAVDPERWGCVVGASKGGMHLAVPLFVKQWGSRQRILSRVAAGDEDSFDAAAVEEEWNLGTHVEPGPTRDSLSSLSSFAPRKNVLLQSERRQSIPDIGQSAWDGLPDDAWLNIWPDAPATAIAREFNIRGPVLAPAAACATGLVSLIRAAELVRSGVCDVVLCGSSDASLQPSLLASYRRLGVLARHGDPQTACQPFDRDRQGFLVGEGAAVLVVESLAHAVQRGAVPLAEFVAGRTFSDGAGVAGLDESAEGLSRAIDGVTRAGGITPAEVDLINLHGTGTDQNDRTEVAALSRVLRGTTPRGLCCAFKGAIGHLMGAAGSVETALTILSLRDQIAPPTANLRTFAPDLKSLLTLPFTGETPTPRRIDTVLKTSLGFGGPVAAVLLRRVGG